MIREIRRPPQSRFFFRCVVGVSLFCIQFLIPHAYVKLCVPKTVQGFLLSPVKSLSLECQILRASYYFYIEFLTTYRVVFTTLFLHRMLAIRWRIESMFPMKK